MSDAIREAFEALDELTEIADDHPGLFRGVPELRDTIKAGLDDALREYVGANKSALQSQTAPAVPEVTHEMISAALCSNARDDEGEFPWLIDILDFSGENKARAVVRAALEAALAAAPQPDHSPDDMDLVSVKFLIQQARKVRNFSRPDNVFEAIPVSVIYAEEQLPTPAADGGEVVPVEAIKALSFMRSAIYCGTPWDNSLDDAYETIKRHITHPAQPHNEVQAVTQFKDELVKSVKPIFRPHIEGVCAVVLDRLRSNGGDA